MVASKQVGKLGVAKVDDGGLVTVSGRDSSGESRHPILNASVGLEKGSRSISEKWSSLICDSFFVSEMKMLDCELLNYR